MGWWGKVTGTDAAKEASRKQQEAYDQAIAQDPFGDAQYKSMAQGMMNDIAAGKNASIDQNQFNDTMQRTVIPTVNSGFGGNMWSTARQKAIQNGSLDLNNQMVNQANSQRSGALGMLQNSANNRSQLYAGKANTYANNDLGLSDYLGMGTQVMGMYRLGKGSKG